MIAPPSRVAESGLKPILESPATHGLKAVVIPKPEPITWYLSSINHYSNQNP